MHVLLIIKKNTAVLDYTIPILYKLRKDKPDSEISILFCRISKYMILRKSKFYKEIFNENNIKVYDFLDFVNFPINLFKSLLIRVFNKSKWDKNNINKIKKIQIKDKLEKIIEKRVKYTSILIKLNPDVILMDNTSSSVFKNNFIYDYLEKIRKKVILLPHAPHHSSLESFTPFRSGGDILPEYCEVWMPFKFDQSWKAAPEKKSQFHYIGYPGLDLEWLNYIKNKNKKNSNNLKCLFIVRRFLDEGEKRTEKHNEFIYDYNEFVRNVTALKESLSKLEKNVEVIVKPHPSNNFIQLKDLFKKIGVSNWEITFEPIYSYISNIDFVVSLYSTILLVPGIVGIPVILINTSAQDFINSIKEIGRLYSGLQNYIENEKSLQKVVKDVVENLEKYKKNTKDIKHIRSFYPDNSAAKALNRIYENLKES